MNTSINILPISLPGSNQMSNIPINIPRIIAPISPNPLRDFVSIAFEIADGAGVDVLECLAHCPCPWSCEL